MPEVTALKMFAGAMRERLRNRQKPSLKIVLIDHGQSSKATQSLPSLSSPCVVHPGDSLSEDTVLERQSESSPYLQLKWPGSLHDFNSWGLKAYQGKEFFLTDNFLKVLE